MKLIGNNGGFIKCFGANSSKDPLIFTDNDNNLHEYPSGHSLLLQEFCAQGNLLSLTKKGKKGVTMHTNQEKLKIN